MTNLQDWIGKSETWEERIAPFPSNALAATLNRDDLPYVDGTPLPPLWHWMHFLPIFPLKAAGYDGHEALGSFLPPVPLPRRMWAGSRLSFHAPMRIGQTLRKVSTIKSVSQKTGRSGDLVFVTVGHNVFDGETLGIDEEHDIVYRAQPSDDAPVPPPSKAPTNAEFSREVSPNPVLLFRYSALTFNGHRIHYDQPFCTGTEGYDGLIVHGPLLATLLLDLLRRHIPHATVVDFSFRALAPVTDTKPFTINGRATAPGAYQLWIARHDGALAMDAAATITKDKPPPQQAPGK